VFLGETSSLTQQKFIPNENKVLVWDLVVAVNVGWTPNPLVTL